MLPDPSKKIEGLEKKVDKVIEEQKQLEHKENTILQKVNQTKTVEEKVEKEVEKDEKLTTIQKNLITTAKNHKYIFSLVTASGVILVWRGLWDLFDKVPLLSYSSVSLLVGLTILWGFNKFKSL